MRDLRDAHPDRYFEMYIAEQQMVAAAVGIQVRRWVPFASTFAAFLTRAYDFIRMAAISRANIRLCGSHAGVSIGEDGPSQMALEDLAMMRAVHGSTVLYPSDANQTARLCRDGRPRGNRLHAHDPGGERRRLRRERRVPDRRLARAEAGDDLAIVAPGSRCTSREGADKLIAEGIDARVIDLYSVKAGGRRHAARGGRGDGRPDPDRQDHWPEGGIGDAVLEVPVRRRDPSRVVRLAVREMPGSGKPAELLAAAGSTPSTSPRRHARSSAPLSAPASSRTASGTARAAARARPHRSPSDEHRARRSGRSARVPLNAEPLEDLDGGAARRALRHAGSNHRPAEHVREKPGSTTRSRAARGRSRPPPAPPGARRRSPRSGRRRPPARLQQVGRVGVEGEAGDRAVARGFQPGLRSPPSSGRNVRP
jgi:transketolase C-terminal domain/subunit